MVTHLRNSNGLRRRGKLQSQICHRRADAAFQSPHSLFWFLQLPSVLKQQKSLWWCQELAGEHNLTLKHLQSHNSPPELVLFPPLDSVGLYVYIIMTKCGHGYADCARNYHKGCFDDFVRCL